MTIITLAKIKRRRAYNKSEYKRFAKDFPNGLEVTEGEMLRVAKLRYNIDWLEQALLPEHLHMEYRWQIAPILADYRRQIAPFEAEYERQRAPIEEADFARQIAPIEEDYQRQIEPFVAEYRRQQALVLFRCLQKKEGK